MAACELTIELDEPNRTYRSGEAVTGTVVVKTTDQVKCKSLEVTNGWATHGRGNIDRGEVDKRVVFEGEWEANREYRYPFSLQSAAWPPTYYGTYLNVSHYIEAKAKVPWAFDPKCKQEFILTSLNAPEDLLPTTQAAAAQNNVGKWMVGIIVLMLFIVPLIMLSFMLIPILLIGGGGFWFFFKFLPKQVTGTVECTVAPVRLAPGEALRGQLSFTPKRSFAVNNIRWTITCVERCVSGSGSNRTTHRHTLMEDEQILVESRELTGGQPILLDFRFTPGNDAPYSMKFSDNELIWSIEVRIDIPRWPDWSQTFPLQIVPSLASESSAGANIPHLPAGSATIAPSATPAEGDLSFSEVCEQISLSQGEPERLQLVLDAIQGLPFNARLDLQGKMFQLPSGMTEANRWYLARERKNGVEVCLLWPPQVEPPRMPAFDWQGRATVSGYDVESDRLLMQVQP